MEFHRGSTQFLGGDTYFYIVKRTIHPKTWVEILIVYNPLRKHGKCLNTIDTTPARLPTYKP